MWLDLFKRVRDYDLHRTETNVTENRVSEPFKWNGGERVLNIRVDVKGLEGDSKLAIRFEQSPKEDGEFYEVGTFPVIGAYHGILVPVFGDWIRYTLVVEEGSNPLTVELGF